MNAAVRAELRKIVSARPLLATLVVPVVYVVLAFGPVLTLPAAERRAQPADTLLRVARGPAAFLAVAMLLLGALVTAGEVRHGTLAATLLVTPRRADVLRAKALAVAVAAVATALLAEVLALAVGSWFVAAHGIASPVSFASLAVTALAVAAGAVLYGLAGVGLGLLARDQTAAVAAALVWVGIVEGMLPSILRRPGLVRWLPGGAANALYGVADPPVDLLPAWAGALMLVAVAGALLGAARVAFTARDVG